MRLSKQLTRVLVLAGTVFLGNALDEVTAVAGELAAAIGDNSIHEHFTHPPAKDSPAEAELKQALKQRYDALVKSLNHRTLADDYPGAVRNLDSPDTNKQSVGIKTLAATDELRAIP